MPLLDIRTRFAVSTGRADLVNPDGSDNGADWFINAGQRLLDQIFPGKKNYARAVKEIAQGSFKWEFKYVKSILQVSIANATTMAYLDGWTLKDLRKAYPQPYSQITPGQPAYYAPNIIGLSPEQVDYSTELDNLYDVEDIKTGNHYVYDGILFMPPADQTYTLQIWGVFYTRALEDDTDESYWTEVYPELLIWAATYQLEMFYRNKVEAAEKLKMINAFMVTIEHDMVAQDMDDGHTPDSF